MQRRLKTGRGFKQSKATNPQVITLLSRKVKIRVGILRGMASAGREDEDGRRMYHAKGCNGLPRTLFAGRTSPGASQTRGWTLLSCQTRKTKQSHRRLSSSILCPMHEQRTSDDAHGGVRPGPLIGPGRFFVSLPVAHHRGTPQSRPHTLLGRGTRCRFQRMAGESPLIIMKSVADFFMSHCKSALSLAVPPLHTAYAHLLSVVVV